jgi:hypothetical protein
MTNARSAKVPAPLKEHFAHAPFEEHPAFSGIRGPSRPGRDLRFEAKSVLCLKLSNHKKVYNIAHTMSKEITVSNTSFEASASRPPLGAAPRVPLCGTVLKPVVRRGALSSLRLETRGGISKQDPCPPYVHVLCGRLGFCRGFAQGPECAIKQKRNQLLVHQGLASGFCET